MRISAVIKAIESFARPSYQESWDNTGVQVGNTAGECTGVLVCLDATPEVVEEAIAHNCNLIVSHHPLLFKPIKKLTGATSVQATAINAIAAGITIYSSHTAADSTMGGVSYEMAKLLGVTPLRTIDPLKDRMLLLKAIVPCSHLEEVQAALFDAGAGAIGNYDCCSFTTEGKGTFRALDGANPYVGEIGLNHTEDEEEISVVLMRDSLTAVENALLETHPYETPAYQIIPMLNELKQLGLGIYGTMDESMSADAFINKVKDAFGCQAVRTTKVHDEWQVRRVALCGGAGGEYISKAIAMGADAYVTADVKYHDFVDYRNRILVIDAGHYETEHPIVGLFAKCISDKLPMVNVRISQSQDNPINYK